MGRLVFSWKLPQFAMKIAINILKITIIIAFFILNCSNFHEYMIAYPTYIQSNTVILYQWILQRNFCVDDNYDPLNWLLLKLYEVNNIEKAVLR